jgi:pantothenate kinase
MKTKPTQPAPTLPELFAEISKEFPEAKPEDISRALLAVIGENVAKYARKEIRMKANKGRN